MHRALEEIDSAPLDRDVLVDVGAVRAAASMTMPGMAMSGGVQVQPTAIAGRYAATAEFAMAGSGQFSVEATVYSPAGRALGPPSRLQVRSTAYGTITVWLTGSAGVLLIVLAVHRVVRRIRGEASPRDRTHPAVGPPEHPGPPGRRPAELPEPDPAPTDRAAPRALPVDPEPPTTPVRTPPDPDPPTRPVPARP